MTYKKTFSLILIFNTVCDKRHSTMMATVYRLIGIYWIIQKIEVDSGGISTILDRKVRTLSTLPQFHVKNCHFIHAVPPKSNVTNSPSLPFPFQSKLFAQVRSSSLLSTNPRIPAVAKDTVGCLNSYTVTPAMYVWTAIQLVLLWCQSYSANILSVL